MGDLSSVRWNGAHSKAGYCTPIDSTAADAFAYKKPKQWQVASRKVYPSSYRVLIGEPKPRANVASAHLPFQLPNAIIKRRWPSDGIASKIWSSARKSYQIERLWCSIAIVGRLLHLTAR
jgi:hypothetical protein